MPGPNEGYSTQHTTQQEHVKLRHQPSDRDQRARQRLKDKAFKAKIKSSAYITLGPATLHTVHQIFYPCFPVLFHLSYLITSTSAGTIPPLYVIQKDRHCMPKVDYYFTNIKPDPITIPSHTKNKSQHSNHQLKIQSNLNYLHQSQEKHEYTLS